MKQSTAMTAFPRFSFKSAFVILLSAIIGGIFLPLFVQSIGLDHKLVNVFGLSLSISFATAFSRNFLDSDRGFDKSFWKTFGLFAILTTIIAYFWVYQNLYM